MESELDSLISRETQKIQAANEKVGKGGKKLDCSTIIQRTLNSRLNRDSLRRILGPALLRTWDEEPHLRCLLLRKEEPKTVQISDDSFMRLSMEAPTQQYKLSKVKTSECLHSSVHVGQRKLLIGEILFMIQHGAKSNVVVYIGAANGQHIPILCEMFPNHKFLLYDPAPFSKQILDYMRRYPDRVSIYNELFPPEAGGHSDRELQAAIAGNESFLLISDIRRRDEEAEAPTNSDVDADMDLQSDICRRMQPKAAHLKCRLPYFDPEANPPEPDIEAKMPKGEIYFQPWCGHKSTETRLVIEPPYSDDNMMTMSSRWYESALYYHNLNSRYYRYVIPALAPLELFVGTIYDSCFDCSFERYTIWLYLTSKTTKGVAAPNYQTFTSVYGLIKRIIGRDDERMLQETSARR